MSISKRVCTMAMQVCALLATGVSLASEQGGGQVAANVPLVKISDSLYHTEHCLFIIPGPGQVTWPSWSSVYSTANIDAYVAALKASFPSDYEFVTIAANDLTPNTSPNVQTRRRVALGIGLDSITGVGVPDFCRYNIGGGSVPNGAFGVLDHEIGHRWGVFLGSEVGEGHWLTNSTATGQMAANYSDDGLQTVKRITGNLAAGFRWTAENNITRNEIETFSDHDLYLQGLAPTFPDLFVLKSPVYNSNGSVSHQGATLYNHAWLVGKHGARSPDYRTSPKRSRIGFVYVARDLAEIQTVYQAVERSIGSFVNGEQIDRTFRFQVPFLVETKFRASVEGLLADLDGNRTPALSIVGPTYLASSYGSALVPFVASDPDQAAPPAVSCVPASPSCAVVGSSVVLSGLATGTHFFTIKAEDAGGKKAFAHFVVDQVDQPSCVPDASTLCLLGNRFAVRADWADYGGNRGQAKAVPLTSDTGYFWFFSSANVETVVKMVSFCGGGTDNVAVYAGGLTDLDVTIRVTDIRTSATKFYRNPLATPFELVRDGPFECPASATTDLLPSSFSRTEVSTTMAPVEAPTALESTGTLAPCTTDAMTLCLLGGRFQVRAEYRDYSGHTGTGQATALTPDTGTFWFFDARNVEVVAKMVSFCGGGSDNVGIYAGGLTDVEATLRVTDTRTGLTKDYRNPLGTPFRLIRDGSFECPASATSGLSP